MKPLTMFVVPDSTMIGFLAALGKIIIQRSGFLHAPFGAAVIFENRQVGTVSYVNARYVVPQRVRGADPNKPEGSLISYEGGVIW